MKYIFYALIFLAFLAIFLPSFLRNYFSEKLTKCIIRNDTENFDKLINKTVVKKMIAPFQIDFLKLNKALFAGDDKEIIKSFEHFDRVNLNANQKRTIYSKAFSYFIEKRDSKRIKKYYDYLKIVSSDEQNHELDIYYDTYIKLSDKHLSEISKRYENDNSIEALPILIQIYNNKKDANKVEYYQKILTDYVKNKDNIK